MSEGNQTSGPSNGAEHEALCTRCGKCCYKKIIVGRTVFITPFPCEYLDTEKNECTIYDKRHELNPECLSIEVGLKHSAFPEDCPYVEEQAPPGYRPALDNWTWSKDWMDFDELADDLDVPDEVREKVRARGPEAPPMWVDAYERIKAQKAAGIAPAATPTPASPNAKAPPTAPPAGSPKLNLLDGSRPAESKPGETPKLSALLKRPGAK